MSNTCDIVLEQMKSRRSVRKFLPQMPERWMLEKVVEAGLWAPSGHNKQPWAFVVVTDE
jgi:nitroreductase